MDAAMIEAIGLDADDTLWENETFFRVTEAEFVAMLADHADGADGADGEILGDKSPETHARVLWRAGVAPGVFVMAGNSMKSDVLPVVTLGGHGVFIPHDIPHDLTWALEQAEPTDHPRLHRLDGIAGPPAQIGRLERDDA